LTISPIVGSDRSGLQSRGSTTHDFRPIPRTISTIGVVVPARNEEERLPRCLGALSTAVDVLRRADSAAPDVRIVVVVDRSTDGTQGIAEQWPGVETVLSDVGRVGAARRAGVAHVLRGAEVTDAVSTGSVGTDGANLDPGLIQLGDAVLVDVAGRRGADLGPGTPGAASCAVCRAALPASGLHAVESAVTEHCRTVGSLWIACTDADSIVPADWLVAQLGYARAGAEMVLGTVVPDPDELAAGLLAAWRLRHTNGDGHPHVHGANMGIRGDMYLTAGGFQDVSTHEDLLLSVSVRSAGGRILSVGANPVITSGRTEGRAPGGMAHYLQEIENQREPLEA
jgi:hypothetical protein